MVFESHNASDTKGRQCGGDNQVWMLEKRLSMKITTIFIYVWSTTISSPMDPMVCVKYTFRPKWRVTL